MKITLAQLWQQGYIVRINNFGDKEKPPHCEKDIKSQVIDNKRLKTIENKFKTQFYVGIICSENETNALA